LPMDAKWSGGGIEGVMAAAGDKFDQSHGKSRELTAAGGTRVSGNSHPTGRLSTADVVRLPGVWMLAWPGMPRLWMAGQWRGLATAFLFSVMLNAALLATFDSLGRVSRLEMGVLWAACGLFWLVSARNSHRWRTGLARLPKKEECDRRFAAAQEAYLKGHWPEAESQLRPLLEMRPDDIESRLLLATLLRRMGRLTDARSQLEEFARRSGSEHWSLEFHREWESLKRLQKAAVDEPGDEDERAA
jgi:hypothetical protein